MEGGSLDERRLSRIAFLRKGLLKVRSSTAGCNAFPWRFTTQLEVMT